MNSIFEEDNEINNTITEAEINKKTIDINKRLTNIFKLDEDLDVPLFNKQPSKIGTSNENLNLLNKEKTNNLIVKSNLTSNTIILNQERKNLIQPIDSSREDIFFNNFNSNNQKQNITSKPPDIKEEEKIKIKPDLKKLNKLFLTEEDDELAYKNIDFKKEEKKIVNPNSKDLPKSSEINKKIENLNENNVNEKENFRINTQKKTFILDQEFQPSEEPKKNCIIKDDSKNIIEKEINKIGNQEENLIKDIEIKNGEKKENNENISENPKKNKAGILDPLTGGIIKEPDANKRKSIKGISDPLSMIRSTVMNKNKNESNKKQEDSSDIPKKEIIAENKNGIIKNEIIENHFKEDNQIIIKNEINKSDLNDDHSNVKEEEKSKTAKAKAEISKVNNIYNKIFSNYLNFKALK